MESDCKDTGAFAPVRAATRVTKRPAPAALGAALAGRGTKRPVPVAAAAAEPAAAPARAQAPAKKRAKSVPKATGGGSQGKNAAARAVQLYASDEAVHAACAYDAAADAAAFEPGKAGVCALHGKFEDGMQLHQAVLASGAARHNPRAYLPCMDCARAGDGDVRSSTSGKEYVVTLFGASTKDGLRCRSCSERACAESKARATTAVAEHGGARNESK